MGAKKRPFYRFVAADSRYARDGRFVETLGYYNPMENPAKVVVERDLIIKWLNHGAQMSETVRGLFRQINLLEFWEKSKAGEPTDGIEIKTEIKERKKRSKKQKAAAAITETPAEEAAPAAEEAAPAAEEAAPAAEADAGDSDSAEKPAEGEAKSAADSES